MTKDDFVKMFRAPMWELALESFHLARFHSPKPSDAPRIMHAEVMLQQMRMATDLLSRMYDVLHPKKGVDDADRKPKA